MTEELLWYWLHIPITMSGKILRFCFTVEDPPDQSDCTIPESPISWKSWSIKLILYVDRHP